MVQLGQQSTKRKKHDDGGSVSSSAIGTVSPAGANATTDVAAKVASTALAPTAFSPLFISPRERSTPRRNAANAAAPPNAAQRNLFGHEDGRDELSVQVSGIMFAIAKLSRKVDDVSITMRRMANNVAMLKDELGRMNRVHRFILDQSNAAANAERTNEYMPPADEIFGVDDVADTGRTASTRNNTPVAGGPSAAQIGVWAAECRKRHLFAAKLAAHYYTENERLDCNCTGKGGKRALSPNRLSTIRRMSFDHFAVQSNENEKCCWLECMRAIDSGTRGMRRVSKIKQLASSSACAGPTSSNSM